jgi:exosortase A
MPYLVLALGLLLLGIAWQDTLLHLADLVWNVEAYSHGVWVPIVSFWLVWRRRAAVIAVGPRLWWPGVLLLLLVQGVWIAGSVVEARILEHLALVLSVQLLVITAIGPQAARTIRFALAFLLLVIPFGGQIVGPLQIITAKSVIWALDISGIPFKADGVLIELSSGLYQVARACAGVKFLFSSVVMGVLLCHLAFSSWYRRALMLAAAFLVPVLANAARVYSTLLIAEWTDQSFAKDVDHIVYGWGFLSVVLVLLIIGAYRFSDRNEETAVSELQAKAQSRASGETRGQPGLGASLMVFVALLLPLSSAVWVSAAGRGAPVCFMAEFEPPACEGCGYRLLPQSVGAPWLEPDRAEHMATWRYRQDATNIFGHTSVYSGEAVPHRMGRNLAYMLPRDWEILEGGVAAGGVPVPSGFQEFVIWRGDSRRLVWQAYYAGAGFHASPMGAKLAVAAAHLKGRRPVAQRIIIATSLVGEADARRQELANFLSTFWADAFLWKRQQPRAGAYNKEEDDKPCAA